MKRNEEPRIVSLETHRRRRQAESRQKKPKPKKPARPPAFASSGGAGERAINWRRVPLLVGVVIAFMAASWLLRQILALSPLH